MELLKAIWLPVESITRSKKMMKVSHSYTLVESIQVHRGVILW